MTNRRVLPRLLVVLAAIVVVLLATTAPAFAHATLVAESPPPGVGLAQAPGAVALKFTEPLNRRLSAVRVLDRSGRDAGRGATLAVVGDPRAMQRKLGLLPPGTYTVQWTSVSTLDGHTVKGSYRFGVGVASDSGESVHSNPVTSEGWAGLAGTWLAFIGLALWAGSSTLGAVALRSGLSSARLLWFTRAGPSLALAGSVVWALSSAAAASGSAWRVNDVVLGSGAGHLRLIVIVATAIAVGLGPLTSRRTIWRAGDATLLGVAVVAEAASGHAAATTVPVWATLLLSVHVLAVGTWVFALTAAALSSSRLSALGALSPYAILGALVVAGTGSANAALELDRIDELVTTTYGKVLLGKVIAILAMSVLGLLHYRSRRERDVPVARIRDLVFSELGVALLAFVLATVLVGFPNPPREAAAAEAAQNAGGAGIALIDTRPGVSVAGGAGPFVIGLSVLPPRPGPVTFRVDVVGAQAGDALRSAYVLASDEGNTSYRFALGGCGAGCFQGPGVIPNAGQWRLDTTLESNRGVLHTTTTTPLPTPDGSQQLGHALDTMSRLQSLQIREQLRGSTDKAAQVATYTFGAPDRFSFSIIGGGGQIHIGQQQFLRESASAPWTLFPPGPAGIDTTFHWPDGYFQDVWGHAAAVRVIGREPVDDIPTDVVAFVRTDVPAWFRLWIDSRGVVRREQMRAEGHIMDHEYINFDNAPVIRPPS